MKANAHAIVGVQRAKAGGCNTLQAHGGVEAKAPNRNMWVGVKVRAKGTRRVLKGGGKGVDDHRRTTRSPLPHTRACTHRPYDARTHKACYNQSGSKVPSVVGVVATRVNHLGQL